IVKIDQHKLLVVFTINVDTTQILLPHKCPTCHNLLYWFHLFHNLLIWSCFRIFHCIHMTCNQTARHRKHPCSNRYKPPLPSTFHRPLTYIYRKSVSNRCMVWECSSHLIL